MLATQSISTTTGPSTTRPTHRPPGPPTLALGPWRLGPPLDPIVALGLTALRASWAPLWAPVFVFVFPRPPTAFDFDPSGPRPLTEISIPHGPVAMSPQGEHAYGCMFHILNGGSLNIFTFENVDRLSRARSQPTRQRPALPGNRSQLMVRAAQASYT